MITWQTPEQRDELAANRKANLIDLIALALAIALAAGIVAYARIQAG